MPKKSQTPEILTITSAQLEELLGTLRAQLPEQTYGLVEGLLRTLLWIMAVLGEKKASLARLRKVLFGSKSEKAGKLFPQEAPPPNGSPASGTKPKRQGHGRRKAGDYPGAKRLPVPHPDLKVGDVCPQCKQGKLYLLKTPARLVRVVAQPLFNALIHELERLRCALCGAVFTAPPPPAAGLGKYDPNVGTMLAIQRYGAGLPMYRIAKWQECFGVPLPASTQWELMDEAAEIPSLIYQTLSDAGAQGTLLHNDDTFMRVQSLRQEIATEENGGRTGIFTTGIICQTGQNQIALFCTGREHAGENLDQLLKRRAASLEPPLQMCDALARNKPKESATDECNCLLHGRRNFVDQIENFPEECRQVIESIGRIYHLEDEIKKAGLSPAERLLRHQEQSGPVLEELQRWMREQLDQKKVEPNSGLGQAIRYMLKYWEKLTRFLKVAGAPLDNNICERALKMAITHRKNSLGYKTIRGAEVGDIYMSVIHTCQLNGVNPFDYLTALQTHAKEVRQAPAQWLPWNYQKNLPTLESG
jgi:transposase